MQIRTQKKQFAISSNHMSVCEFITCELKFHAELSKQANSGKSLVSMTYISHGIWVFLFFFFVLFHKCDQQEKQSFTWICIVVVCVGMCAQMGFMILRRNLFIFAWLVGSEEADRKGRGEIDMTCTKDYWLELNQQCCIYAVCAETYYSKSHLQSGKEQAFNRHGKKQVQEE